ncbi:MULTISPECIES: hypothetical protein [Thalassospira]|uniref:Uncharacterized protein n=1 Tax=Thalassospira profundimaris TaxID=502049 RepID=A0A367X4Y7_9PROT|nr:MULTISPECIES: hypothetical protein [Thalassospira]MEE3046407.1 hypothetical protein [Pseudomonadota bacterium]HAI31604.1 hypothetical protein [Thalassospira sp.]KZC98684.1 hypothetical protein AUQ41_15160 [Thalassospira sp. MCCC 1A02898]ONH86816.1 hypothetical protein TH47_14545 [Thalassospira sp. MCCC 1A02803]RCK47752.1 hypothetical protein TH30_04655 [Thalassospira profundimaris]|tara:strand:+ start:936 stop:1328 length:393 start_codon:yes stop_codon:yes gene_type:complete
MNNFDKKAQLKNVRHYILPEIANWLGFVLRMGASFLACVSGYIGGSFLLLICFVPNEAIYAFEILATTTPETLQSGALELAPILTGLWFMHMGLFAAISGKFPFSAKASKHPEKIGAARSAFPSIEGESK